MILHWMSSKDKIDAMMLENQTIWTLDPSGQQRLNVVIQNYRAWNKLTLRRLVDALHFPGDFRTLDHYLNGRSPWQPEAVKAVLYTLAKIQQDWEDNYGMEPGPPADRFAANWARHLANPTPTETYPLCEPLNRRCWNFKLRHADLLVRRIKAYESRVTECWTLSSRGALGWAMPKRMMKQYHAYRTRNVSAEIAALNYFERSRFWQYVHSDVSCRRTILISEKGFIDILNGRLSLRNESPCIFEPADVLDYVLLLHDCANRKKLRLGFFRDIELNEKSPNLLIWCFWSEHTFIGDRFYFEDGRDGSVWLSTEEAADGMTIAERIRLRSGLIADVMPNVIPSLDSSQVPTMFRDSVSKLNRVLFSGTAQRMSG
jgi:hypothetical protein